MIKYKKYIKKGGENVRTRIREKIADFLSSIDNKIESVEKELEELKEFKKGLLQQMFI